MNILSWILLLITLGVLAGVEYFCFLYHEIAVELREREEKRKERHRVEHERERRQKIRRQLELKSLYHSLVLEAKLDLNGFRARQQELLEREKEE